MYRCLLSVTVALAAFCTSGVVAFSPPSSSVSLRTSGPQVRYDTSVGIFDKVGQFFEELDAFVDDATARRLGNGAAFYGKRKSNFYGKEDKSRKRDRSVPDPTEDYQGPTSTGLFKWMPDEDGQLRPVTRSGKTNLERPPQFWDRAFAEKDD